MITKKELAIRKKNKKMTSSLDFLIAGPGG